MLYPQLEQKLNHARQAVMRATSENIIELCKAYLVLLTEYRSKLFELQGTSEIIQQPSPASPLGEIVYNRKVVRGAIENTTQERNRTEMLLLSFTTVSGYQAVEVFNQQKYVGHDDWELRASGLRSAGSPGDDVMTIQEAVNIAGLLRREEYVLQNAAPALIEVKA